MSVFHLSPCSCPSLSHYNPSRSISHGLHSLCAFIEDDESTAVIFFLSHHRLHLSTASTFNTIQSRSQHSLGLSTLPFSSCTSSPSSLPSSSLEQQRHRKTLRSRKTQARPSQTHPGPRSTVLPTTSPSCNHSSSPQKPSTASA